MEKETMIGEVVEIEDNSALGSHWDVSNTSEDLTYLLEQFLGKKVKVTIEVLD